MRLFVICSHLFVIITYQAPDTRKYNTTTRKAAAAHIRLALVSLQTVGLTERIHTASCADKITRSGQSSSAVSHTTNCHIISDNSLLFAILF
jgi:hypothetical protein